MSEQYIRQCRLTVEGGSGAIDLSELRITFEVRTKDIQFPNRADIRVYNLSDKTAHQLRKEAKTVTLQAGYRDVMYTIFKGSILQARVARENPVDKFLGIIATSGDRPHNIAVVNSSLAAGHTYRDQVNECLKVMKPLGMTEGFICDLGSKKMPRGRVLHGKASDILRDIATATGTSWSIQNDTFQMVRNNGFLPGDVTVLNSDTGLVGMAEQTIQGIECRCLLNGNLVPGGRIKIDQKSVNAAAFGADYKNLTNSQLPGIAADGIYKMFVVDHVGDTRGNAWYTEIVGIAAGQPISSALALRGITTGDPQDDIGAKP